jgi:hypothetical protein
MRPAETLYHGRNFQIASDMGKSPTGGTLREGFEFILRNMNTGLRVHNWND